MKILIQNSPFKFLNNLLFLNIPDLQIQVFNNDNDLYKIYFNFKPEVIILSNYHLTKNTKQFIEDVHTETKIFVYHFYHEDSYSNVVQELNHLNIKHITHHDSENSILIPDNLVNTNLYNYTDITKIDKIVCFLDGFKEIPPDINSYLYPNNNIPLLLFNNPNIKHPQNLGILAEPHKAELLKSYKYYLSCGALNDYSNEALLCGCCVLSPDDLSTYLEKNTDKINHNHITYEQFLIGSIL
jgi:hypothetical protein